MSKLSTFFASLAVLCEEQASATLASVQVNASALEKARITESAENLAHVSREQRKTSTTHAEELHKLSAVCSSDAVSSMLNECGISEQAIASLAKYNKAKLNASLLNVASGVRPDWTKNHENFACFFELLLKQSTSERVSQSVALTAIQRMLGHSTLTQASYISNLLRALGVARESGSKRERTLHVIADSKLYQRIARMYGLIADDAQEAESDPQDDARVNADAELASESASE